VAGFFDRSIKIRFIFNRNNSQALIIILHVFLLQNSLKVTCSWANRFRRENQL